MYKDIERNNINKKDINKIYKSAQRYYNKICKFKIF